MGVGLWEPGRCHRSKKEIECLWTESELALVDVDPAKFTYENHAQDTFQLRHQGLQSIIHLVGVINKVLQQTKVESKKMT